MMGDRPIWTEYEEKALAWQPLLGTYEEGKEET